MHVAARLRAHARLAALRHRLRDERGFTLIEVLVATMSGVLVTAAMGAIVIVSVHFSSNYSDRVDSDQQGRVALEKVIQALNSSCVAAGVSPVVSSGSTISDATHIYFYSTVAAGPSTGTTGLTGTTGSLDAPVITPWLDEVALVSSASGGSSLVMYSYPNTGGTAPSPTNATPWTFSSTPTFTYTLLPHATAPSSALFAYSGYTSGGTIGSPYALPLSSTNASTTAQVAITLTALPTDNNSTQGRATNLQDSVVLRLTPASAATTAANAPCT